MKPSGVEHPGVFLKFMKDLHRFETKEYTVASGKLTRPHKYLFLSDTHACEYGENNDILLKAVEKESPDAIFLGGDVIVARDVKTAPDTWLDAVRPFLTGLSAIAPVYAAEGNHEQALRDSTLYYDKYAEYYDMMRGLGIKQLINRHVSVDESELFGLRPNDVYYKKFRYKRPGVREVRDLLGEPCADRMNIVLSHHPRFFDALTEWGADLVLSGHLHGGSIRVGNLGLISPEPVILPKYSGGRYTKNHTTMIVNCGLGTHTFKVRIGNPGEISVLCFLPQDK